MTWLYGYPQYVVDRETGLPVVSGHGGYALDPATSAELPATDPDTGAPVQLTTGPTGLLRPVRLPATTAVAVFGDVRSTIYSDAAHDSAALADSAMTIATAARTTAEAAHAMAESLAGSAVRVRYSRLGPDGRVFFRTTPVADGGGDPLYDLTDPDRPRVSIRFP